MSGTGTTTEQQQAALMQTMAALNLPQVIPNSYQNGFSPTEITSVLSFGPRAILTLIMSPSVAKSFAMALLETVQQYDDATGLTTLTIQELSARVSARHGG